MRELTMQVKTYRASGMQDALAKVKADLGPDAIILSTQRIDDSSQGHGAALVEIRATSESKNRPSTGLSYFQRISKGQPNATKGAKPKFQVQQLEQLLAPLVDEMRDLKELVRLAGNADAPEAEYQTMAPVMVEAPSGSISALERSRIVMLDDEEEEDGREAEALRRSLLRGRTPGQADRIATDQIKLLSDWLTDCAMAPIHRERILTGVRTRLQGLKRPAREQVEGALIQELVERIRVASEPELDKRSTVAFIGPTGVGKTTTLAKTAATLTMDKRKSVGLITIDTYRIGAVAQLRKYASILELPIEVVVDRVTLEQALRRLSYCDVVLIDTVGRSPRDQEPLRHLRSLFHGVPNLSFELCMSATTSLRDMRGIMELYRIMDPDSVTFTKLDETFSIGPLISAHLEERLPLSIFTTGQRVPDDMERASVERILSMIIPTQ